MGDWPGGGLDLGVDNTWGSARGGGINGLDGGLWPG